MLKKIFYFFLFTILITSCGKKKEVVDNILLDHAVKNLKEDPYKYLMLFFKKIISFLFIDINSYEK